MRMIGKVELVLVSATAAAFLSGCNGTQRRCVDAAGNPLPETQCRNTGGRGMWYYGGGIGSGGRVNGGSYTAPSSGTSRGGFGGSSSGGIFGG